MESGRRRASDRARTDEVFLASRPSIIFAPSSASGNFRRHALANPRSEAISGTLAQRSHPARNVATSSMVGRKRTVGGRKRRAIEHEAQDGPGGATTEVLSQQIRKKIAHAGLW
ncbi:hypothetical protein Purlil1_12942 [Purpureocillium lilacinum]|uniref:Uncharacterized protein n=1 Tax=Purpureocillium lilacinum TaxID=33203 RepID=A0ABR0BFP3_PURLI|nr:hypothetical protein Purlil1_12942 [Purpureocillium lilacinum]